MGNRIELDNKKLDRLKHGECLEETIDGHKILVCGLDIEDLED